MALTRAAIQRVLIQELGGFLQVAGLDSTTIDTPNDSLENAIGRGISSCGGTVADPPTVTDADVATITAGFYKFSLMSQFYLLDTIWGNWAKVDQRDGDTEQKLNQLSEALLKKKEAILEELKDPDIAILTKVPGPPVIGTIKVGSRGFMRPYYRYTR